MLVLRVPNRAWNNNSKKKYAREAKKNTEAEEESSKERNESWTMITQLQCSIVWMSTVDVF